MIWKPDESEYYVRKARYKYIFTRGLALNKNFELNIKKKYIFGVLINSHIESIKSLMLKYNVKYKPNFRELHTVYVTDNIT